VKTASLTVTTVLAAILVGCPSNGPQIVDEAGLGTYPVAKLMERLDDVIGPVAAEARKNGLSLTTVKLTFNVVVTDEKAGELGLLFVKAGGEAKSATTTQYTVELGVPSDVDQGFVPVSTDDYLRSFSNALHTLVAESASYSIEDLTTQKISGQLKFYILAKEGVGAEAEFKVVPITIKAGAAATEERTQQIDLVFEKPGAKGES
jgi:hypothetical protein